MCRSDEVVLGKGVMVLGKGVMVCESEGIRLGMGGMVW